MTLLQHNQFADIAVDIIEQSKVFDSLVLRGKSKLNSIINARQLFHAGIV